ncbi:hypothetical protein T09_1895 [Trichinella sp. T9]|nr:hypothetical protein T09_1895 [Trichinella sp. T9]
MPQPKHFWIFFLNKQKMNFIDKILLFTIFTRIHERKYDWKSSIPSTRTDKFLSIIICKRKEQKWNNRATDAQLIGWYSKEILLLNVEPYYISVI